MKKEYGSPVMIVGYEDKRTVAEIVEILEENAKEEIKGKGVIIERNIVLTNVKEQSRWEVELKFTLEDGEIDKDKELVHFMKLTERAMKLLEMLRGGTPIMQRQYIDELLKEYKG